MTSDEHDNLQKKVDELISEVEDKFDDSFALIKQLEGIGAEIQDQFEEENER